jgi:outer membrane protein OmpA-like peptidoglycan-associated protein
MTPRPPLPGAAGAVTGLVLAAALAGCDGLPADHNERRCRWMTDASRPPGAGRTALLIDVTNSTRSMERAGAPDYADALRPVLQQVVERGDVVTIGTFDGSAVGVAWNKPDLITDAERQNERRDKREREEAVDCLSEHVRKASTRRPRHAGTDVTGAIGIGHPAAGQPQPDSAWLDWLKRLWENICLKSGAGKCEASTDAVKMASGGSAPQPGPGVPDPPVLFPAADGALDIPAAALFDTDSTRLRPDGIKLIQRVAADIRTTPRDNVEVHGYTDSTGESAYNAALSERRAKAVAAVLLARGVHVTRAVGHGETGPLCTEHLSGGAVNQAALQCNRRVRIQAGPSSAQ